MVDIIPPKVLIVCVCVSQRASSCFWVQAVKLPGLMMKASNWQFLGLPRNNLWVRVFMLRVLVSGRVAKIETPMLAHRQEGT